MGFEKNNFESLKFIFNEQRINTETSGLIFYQLFNTLCMIASYCAYLFYLTSRKLFFIRPFSCNKFFKSIFLIFLTLIFKTVLQFCIYELEEIRFYTLSSVIFLSHAVFTFSPFSTEYSIPKRNTDISIGPSRG